MTALVGWIQTFLAGFQTDSRPVGLKQFQNISDDELLNTLFTDSGSNHAIFPQLNHCIVSPKGLSTGFQTAWPPSYKTPDAFQAQSHYSSFLNR